MWLVRYLIVPVAIAIVAVVYWFVSYEPAGTAMLVIFALAMLVMIRVLLPTAGDVGPTAPVDPDWRPRD